MLDFSLMLLMNICAKNPPLRKDKKRYILNKKKPRKNTFSWLFLLK